MTDKERYFWDLNGHLVARNVLNARELKAVNDAIDYVAKRQREGRRIGLPSRERAAPMDGHDADPNEQQHTLSAQADGPPL
jgi:hypothetical protein